MNVDQVYEQAIKPLSAKDKLAIARLIINEFERDVPQADNGFDYLKRVLPQIERISLTDQELANINLSSSKI